MLTAADARTNTSSANYKAGYSAGKNDVTLSVSGATVTASNGKSATVAYKGTYYSSTGYNVGTAGDYFHATFPEGYYATEGNSWAPEVRVPITTMNSNGWYTSDQYNSNYNNGYNNGKWSVKNGGQNVTLTGVHGAYDDYTFTYQGRAGYNGVIFAITRAEYWIYAGGAVSSVSDAADISTSYNSSNGVITIHAYRHTKLVGTIYYY